VEAQERYVPVADDARRVDDEDRAPYEAARPEHPIGPDHRSVRIGEQRDGEAVLGPEPFVGVEGLRGDPEHLRIQLVEAVGGIAVGAELAGANRGEVAGIKREHEPPTPEVGEAIGAPIRAGELEVRSRIADLDAGHPGLTVTLRIATVARGVPASPLSGSPRVAIRFTAPHPELTLPTNA
jgi:hypothetical protein